MAQTDSTPIGETDAESLAPWRPRLQPKARLRWDEVGKRYMLVFPEAALMLNDTAPEILKLCNGEHTVEAIVNRLTERFTGAERSVIEQDVMGFLTRLKTRGLLEG